MLDLTNTVLEWVISLRAGPCMSCDSIVLSPPTSDHQPTAAAFSGGTRAPVTTFKTAFKNKSTNELREIFLKDFAGGLCWALHCFAVLDKRSVEDQTAFIVSIDPEDAVPTTQALNHRCEFRITLDLLIQFDMQGTGTDNEPGQTDVVYTYKDYLQRVNPAAARALSNKQQD